ncbi:hypothetical protein [Pseudomonas arsenicoxydans]|uniref:Uncharacterized protein n=1 Tax=Pseudomonas arsenicoxydans TaxID=702115 RepID=A0A4P6GAP4_9PSED|nr:hypothetical protein [Pseudomonas arsenicoxydans]QAY86742.1 hypothetical protein CUN61_23525 [Pseudomonas arsenicoxydans]
MTQVNASAAVPPPAPESSQLSTHFGGPTLLFGAYLFFYSWLHLFYYFKTFGIPLVSLDISLYFYLAFAWTVAKQFGVWYLFGGALVYVLLNSGWSSDQRPIPYFLHKVLFTVFLIVGLWGTSVLAEHFGTLQAQQVRDGGVLRPIRLHFDEKYVKSYPPELMMATASKDGGIKEAVLLIETAATYYVLVQKVLVKTDKQPQRYDSFGMVYQVPKKQVTYIEIDVPNMPRVTRTLFSDKFL